MRDISVIPKITASTITSEIPLRESFRFPFTTSESFQTTFAVVQRGGFRCVWEAVLRGSTRDKQNQEKCYEVQLIRKLLNR